MNIVVCIKQVPANTHVKMDPQTHTLIRDGAGTVINSYDLHALEAALELRELYGGKVTAFTMGPLQAADVLKTAIGMTVDDGILISGREFAGADTLATSYALAHAIKKYAPADIVLCGKLAVDGDTAQVGPGLSQWLGMSLVANAVEIKDISNGRITVSRLMYDGIETVRTSLPVVITVSKELNNPRIESIKGRLRAANFEPKIVSAEDIKCDFGKIGLKGSPTSVRKVFVPDRETVKNEIVEGKDVADKAEKIADYLRKAQIVV